MKLHVRVTTERAGLVLYRVRVWACSCRNVLPEIIRLVYGVWDEETDMGDGEKGKRERKGRGRGRLRWWEGEKKDKHMEETKRNH